MKVKTYINTEDRITAMAVDGNFLWLGFKDGADVILKQVSAFNPEIVYYEIPIKAEEITGIVIGAVAIYLSLDSATRLGMRLTKTNPLAAPGYFNKPSGVIEKAIDLVIGGSSMYFITPGVESGENAKVIRFVTLDTTTATKTIDLPGIHNVKTITAKDANNLWTATYEQPIKLVKIYHIGDGDYDFSTWEIN